MSCRLEFCKLYTLLNGNFLYTCSFNSFPFLHTNITHLLCVLLHLMLDWGLFLLLIFE